MTSTRGFACEEFRNRTARAQTRMHTASLDALLLTTEPEVRYYTGFLTRFWESPTRPWFVVLPASGAPIAVIPQIGASLMASTWVQDIRTWAAPDLVDDGVSLLCDTLHECVPEGGRIGIAQGHESHLRMPLRDFRRLESALVGRPLVEDGGITATLRQIKSSAEIEKIRAAVRCSEEAFSKVAQIAEKGTGLDTVFRRFQMQCLAAGADCVPYLAGACAEGGYDDVISPATARRLQDGDVLMLDTGVMRDGYFCDFDRNFSVGQPSVPVRDAHKKLVEASARATEIACAGRTMADLHNAMAHSLGEACASGRLGHGIGMQLTEGPSILPDEHTVLAPGMVLAIEPVIALPDGKIMVHEENIAVTERSADPLTTPHCAEISVLS